MKQMGNETQEIGSKGGSPSPLRLGSAIRIPDTKNRALVGAFKRGMSAAENGEHRNPYGDLRAVRGSVTFSRAFSRFWTRGHDLRMDELQQNMPLTSLPRCDNVPAT